MTQSKVVALTARQQAVRLAAFQDRPADSGAALASTTSTEAQLAAAATQAGVVETRSLRTANSRTFATPLGVSQTVLSQAPLNYRDASGQWAAINDSLVADTAKGFAYKNAGDAFQAEFPSSLASGPVKLGFGDQWVAFQVTGASSAIGTVSGNAITYPDVFPGVSVAYAVTPSGVRETLTLASAAAVAAYAYTVTTSGAVALSQDESGVQILDGTTTLARFAPSWAVDAAADSDPSFSVVSTTVKAVTGGYALAMVLNPTWLADQSRVFPVTIDPTVITAGPSTSVSESQSCPIQSGTNHGTSYCAYGYSVAGDSSSPSGTWRSLAQFSFGSSIPQNALVQSADYAFMPRSFSGTSSLSLDVYDNAEAWDPTWACWDNRKHSTAWTSAGGAQSGSVVFNASVPSSAVGSYQHLYLNSLVQSWVDQSVTNSGLILRAHSETTSTGTMTFYDPSSTTNQPYLNVYWSARTGDDGIRTQLKRSLSDRSTLSVDPGNGNLLLSTTDMSAVGTGPGSKLEFKHFYNSADAWNASANPGGTTTSQLGVGWSTDNSLDSRVTLWSTSGGGAATVLMPGGVLRQFNRTSSSSVWDPPDGVSGDFSYDSSAHQASFVDHKSGLKYIWNVTVGNPSTGQLASISTSVGNTITFNQVSSSDEQITDTKGNRFDQALAPAVSGGATVMQSITATDGSGRSVSFGYNSSTGQLTSYTDATGAKTNYYYDATTGMLNEIKDVTSGNDTTISYYPSGGTHAGWVNTVTQTTTDCAHGSTPQSYTTTYSYPAPTGGPSGTHGETDVTDPSGTLITKYFWDGEGRTIESVDPAGNKKDSSYDATTGQISTYTDAVTGGVTTLGYLGGMISSLTEPKPDSTHTGARSTIDTRSNTTTGSSYQGPAAVPTQTTDAEGHHTSYTVPHTGQTYGGMSLVTQVSQGINGTQTATQNLTYNTSGAKNGTVATIVNSNGQTTSYGYDATTGNLTTVTPPTPQQPTTYTYDSDNRVHTVTNGNGHTTTYTYDADDRPTKVAYDDGTYIQYTYDTLGNLVTRHDRDYTGSTVDTITYDGLNRPTAQTYRGESQSFCYDASNHLTSLTDGGGTVSYGYSSTGFLTTVTEPGGTGCSSYDTITNLPPSNSRCIAVKMDQNNRINRVAYPGGVTRELDYSNSGKITYDVSGKGSTSYVALVPNWNDASGNETDLLQSRQDNMPSTNVTTGYAYDGLNRLTNANNVITNTGNMNAYTATTRNESYSYDTEGNITQIVAGSTTNFAYDNDDQLCYSGTASSPTCSTTGGTSYTYDGAGNLTGSGAGFAATYDAANVTTGMNDIISGGSSNSATYPDYGQQPRSNFNDASFGDTILGLSSATTTSATTNQRIDVTRMPDGTILSLRIGANSGYNPATTTNSYFSMLDQQNSVLGLTDATGALVARYAYNPWGNETTNTTGGSSGSGTSTTINNVNHIRWLATYSDPETHLYKFGVRYYSPRLARFSQIDPKNHPLDLGQQDKYSYAANAPTLSTDPSGTNAFVDVASGFIAGALGFAAGAGTEDPFVVGAVIGFSYGFLDDAGNQYLEKGSVDFGQSLRAGLIGGALGLLGASFA